jgi:hypothetical protein
VKGNGAKGLKALDRAKNIFFFLYPSTISIHVKEIKTPMISIAWGRRKG